MLYSEFNLEEYMAMVRLEVKTNIAKSMLQDGDPIDKIAKHTSLSLSQIQEL